MDVDIAAVSVTTMVNMDAVSVDVIVANAAVVEVAVVSV